MLTHPVDLEWLDLGLADSVAALLCHQTHLPLAMSFILVAEVDLRGRLAYAKALNVGPRSITRLGLA